MLTCQQTNAGEKKAMLELFQLQKIQNFPNQDEHIYSTSSHDVWFKNPATEHTHKNTPWKQY